MMDELKPVVNNELCYTPSETIQVFQAMLHTQNLNAKLIRLRGIYKEVQSPKSYYSYDVLFDENTGDEITVQLTPLLKSKLQHGSLIVVTGTIERKITSKGFIQIYLKATQIETEAEQKITERELKLFEIQKTKISRGYKDVYAIIRNLIYEGKKPTIALVFPETSIVEEEFDIALGSTEHIILERYRVPFNHSSFIPLLCDLDNKGFDAIAIVRGGGSGIEFFDDPDILKPVVNLKTPVISAVGHKADNIFIKKVADKPAEPPANFGAELKQLIDETIERKSKSRALLVEDIKKQYEDEIKKQGKQNQELTLQIKNLTDTHKAVMNENAKQVLALQNQLKEITESNNKKDQAAQKQISFLTTQIKKMEESSKEENGKFLKQIENMTRQLTENQIQSQKDRDLILEKNKEINRLQNASAYKTGMIVFIIISILLFCILLFK